MKGGVDVVKPLLAGGQGPSSSTVIMATVRGDLHDIGKNLVTMMLEGAGFKVIDLGVDLDVEKLIEQVKAIRPDILGLSALLTTTMPEMQKVIGELKAQGLRDKVKVIVGGAPVDRAFAEKIGADGYGANAAEAVELARVLTTKKG
jgi:5-methyltetrahydrofolate--homocysteine methyltransferase